MVSHLNVAGLRVIAPSYRGHGGSDKPATGYALDQMANDVLDVADAAGAQRFVLVGSARVESLHNMLPFTQSVYLGWCWLGQFRASEFPVPTEVGKAWCDAQHNRDAAFNLILAPFTKFLGTPDAAPYALQINALERL
jgi:hypothetical protein